MTSSTKTSIITTLLVLLFATLAQAADNTVWELRLKDGKPTNCQLAFTRDAPTECLKLFRTFKESVKKSGVRISKAEVSLRPYPSSD
jgi:hypothetical protein